LRRPKLYVSCSVKIEEEEEEKKIILTQIYFDESVKYTKFSTLISFRRTLCFQNLVSLLEFKIYFVAVFTLLNRRRLMGCIGL
jgi:hypothetical protein